MDVPAILKRAADKAGFTRVRYNEADIPTSTSNITVFVMLGDIRSTFGASSILLKRYREEMKGSKYFILCSWNGCESLFPYVDEYWSLRDPGVLAPLLSKATRFENTSEMLPVYLRSLNSFFEDVIEANVLDQFYFDGLKKDFFDRFRHVKRFLPVIPSAGILGETVYRQFLMSERPKVAFCPTNSIYGWRMGKVSVHRAPAQFWVTLAERLHATGYTPVVCRTFYSHDISGQTIENCIHLRDDDMGKVMAALRLSHCTLDVFNGFSVFSIAARSPYIACDDRNRFEFTKSYEIEDLCGSGVPRDHIFAFPTVIESESPEVWDVNLFEMITAKLNKFLPKIDRDKLPSTSEVTDIVPYSVVRSRRMKKFGTRFIQVPRQE